MLLKYVKNDNNEYLGCVAALDANHVGWSQCCLEKDTFDKQWAKHIAIERAKRCGTLKNTKEGTYKFPHCPNDCKYSPVFVEYNLLIDRAKRYFKENK